MDRPDIHIRACIWLATRGDLGVLRCFRGFRQIDHPRNLQRLRYAEDQTYRILHQGDQDGTTAYKTSRDTKRVLQRHPATAALSDIRGESSFWWVPGADDERNPSMQAAGIMSNITSSRADEFPERRCRGAAQHQDAGGSRNNCAIASASRRTFLYQVEEALYRHAARTIRYTTRWSALARIALTIRMFEHEHPHPPSALPMIFRSGLNLCFRDRRRGRCCLSKALTIVSLKPASSSDRHRELVERLFPAAPGRNDSAGRTAEASPHETRTINEWDSQYQLHSKPVAGNPARPGAHYSYDLRASDPLCQWRGRNVALARPASSARRPTGTARSGKIKSDASAFTLLLTDARGQLYWHTAQGLTGSLQSSTRKTGSSAARVMQVRELVLPPDSSRCGRNQWPGGFVPNILRQALKGTGCGSAKSIRASTKQKRILDAFEAPYPLASCGRMFLYSTAQRRIS